MITINPFGFPNSRPIHSTKRHRKSGIAILFELVGIARKKRLFAIKMSEDEFEMTSFKRRKITENEKSDDDEENQAANPVTTKRRLRKKQIDLDDIDVLNENEGQEEKVGDYSTFFHV